jgi:hypothetical protein
MSHNIPLKLRDWIDEDKIDWILLSANPSIFTYDYVTMKKNHKDLKEEIIVKTSKKLYNMNLGVWQKK